MGKRRGGIGSDGETDDGAAEETAAAMCLVSASFADGEALPTAHTGDGGNLSPPLAWGDVPRGARSLVLLFEGPDPTGRAGAPPFSHWILYNLQPSLGGLELAADQTGLPAGCCRGRSDFGRTHYVGPVLDFGRHEYSFRLFALDAALDGRALGQASWDRLLRAMEPHLMAEAELSCFVERAAASWQPAAT
jgi:Raf kinase inhibitor-like YbhB/YbcL family protein